MRKRRVQKIGPQTGQCNDKHTNTHTRKAAHDRSSTYLDSFFLGGNFKDLSLEQFFHRLDFPILLTNSLAEREREKRVERLRNSVVQHWKGRHLRKMGKKCFRKLLRNIMQYCPNESEQASRSWYF